MGEKLHNVRECNIRKSKRWCAVSIKFASLSLQRWPQNRFAIFRYFISFFALKDLVCRLSTATNEIGQVDWFHCWWCIIIITWGCGSPWMIQNSVPLSLAFFLSIFFLFFVFLSPASGCVHCERKKKGLHLNREETFELKRQPERHPEEAAPVGENVRRITRSPVFLKN